MYTRENHSEESIQNEIQAEEGLISETSAADLAWVETIISIPTPPPSPPSFRAEIESLLKENTDTQVSSPNLNSRYFTDFIPVEDDLSDSSKKSHDSHRAIESETHSVLPGEENETTEPHTDMPAASTPKRKRSQAQQTKKVPAKRRKQSVDKKTLSKAVKSKKSDSLSRIEASIQEEKIIFASKTVSPKNMKKMIKRKRKSCIQHKMGYLKSLHIYTSKRDGKVYGKISKKRPLPQGKTLVDCLNDLTIKCKTHSSTKHLVSTPTTVSRPTLPISSAPLETSLTVENNLQQSIESETFKVSDISYHLFSENIAIFSSEKKINDDVMKKIIEAKIAALIQEEILFLNSLRIFYDGSLCVNIDENKPLPAGMTLGHCLTFLGIKPEKPASPAVASTNLSPQPAHAKTTRKRKRTSSKQDQTTSSKKRKKKPQHSSKKAKTGKKPTLKKPTKPVSQHIAKPKPTPRPAPGSKKFTYQYSYNHNENYPIALVPATSDYTGQQVQEKIVQRLQYASFKFLRNHIGIATNSDGAIFFIKKPFTDGSTLNDWLIKIGFNSDNQIEKDEKSFTEGIKFVCTREKCTPIYYITYQLDLKTGTVSFHSPFLNDKEIEKVIKRKIKTLKGTAGYVGALKLKYNNEQKLYGSLNSKYALAKGKSLFDCLQALEIRPEAGEDLVHIEDLSGPNSEPSIPTDNHPRYLLPFAYSLNQDAKHPFAIIELPESLPIKQGIESISGRFRNLGLKYLRPCLGVAGHENQTIILYVKKQLPDNMTLEACMEKMGFNSDQKKDPLSEENAQKALGVLLMTATFLTTFHITFRLLSQHQIVVFNSDILPAKKIKKIIKKKIKSAQKEASFLKSFIFYAEDSLLCGKISELNPLPDNKTLGDCLSALEISPVDEASALILSTPEVSDEHEKEAESETTDNNDCTKLLYRYSYYEDKDTPVAVVRLDTALKKKEVYNISTTIRRRITRHPQLKALSHCINSSIDKTNIIFYLHQQLPDEVTLKDVMEKIGFDTHFKEEISKEAVKKFLKPIARNGKVQGLPTFYFTYAIHSNNEFILTSDLIDSKDIQVAINRKINLLKRKAIFIKPITFSVNEEGQLLGQVMGKNPFPEGTTIIDYLNSLGIRPSGIPVEVDNENGSENEEYSEITGAMDQEALIAIIEAPDTTDEENEIETEDPVVGAATPGTPEISLLRDNYPAVGFFGGQTSSHITVARRLSNPIHQSTEDPNPTDPSLTN